VPRQINRLSPRAVATLTKPGRHADGNGLYLIVDPTGAKRWAFLFRWEGKLKEMGLGGLSSVPLAKAREVATEHRATLAAGRSPLAAKKAAKAAQITFGEFADDYLKTKLPGWKNAKHRRQWEKSLKEYASPLRSKPLGAIETAGVLEVLKPIWTTKSETASRLRGRVEAVLDAARAANLRTGENPARWRGHLDHLLPRRRKLTRGHHRALRHSELPKFVAELRLRPATASLALEFLILTCARSGEVLGAEWSEIDLEAALWTIPKQRMKSNREHRVPLTDRAREILIEAKKLSNGRYVFPGDKAEAPLSNMALSMLLRRMRVTNATVHGFRSSFRDWAGDETSFAREVAEAALSHAVGDETEQAYRRSDALAKRRKLMEAWARFCASKPADIVPFAKHSARTPRDNVR
jgi:integrase